MLGVVLDKRFDTALLKTLLLLQVVHSCIRVSLKRKFRSKIDKLFLIPAVLWEDHCINFSIHLKLLLKHD